jgi:very-short-patch-repair endonuclease
LASRQGGVITRSQLFECGLTEGQADRLVTQRQLREVLPAAYVHSSAPASPLDQRLWTAALWTNGVISHRTAAGLWQIPTASSDSIHVTVGDRRSRRYPPWMRLHRVPLIPDADTDQLEDLRVTSRVRTILDLLRTERPGAAQSLLDRSLQQCWLGAADLQRSVVEGRGRSGNTQLRKLLAGLEPGAEAESERLLHRILRQSGCTGWIPQYQIVLPGRRIRVDVALPQHRLAIEVDGKLYHDEFSDRFEDDRARQNELINAGWRVLRFTWRQLKDRPDLVMATISRSMAAVKDPIV